MRPSTNLTLFEPGHMTPFMGNRGMWGWVLGSLAFGAVAHAGNPLQTELWRGFHDPQISDSALISRLEGLRPEVQSLEDALLAGPPIGTFPAGMTRLPLTAPHVDYSTELLVYVPSSYDPSRKHSLYLVLHGGNFSMDQVYADKTAQSYIAPWVDNAEKFGIIVAAPITERGWGAVGKSIEAGAIRTLAQKLNIDPNRVYVWGQSMGGHGSWRAGLHTPDWYAGVSPVCGGYDYPVQMLKQLRDIPIYQVWGANDPHPAGLNVINAKLAQELGQLGYDVKSVEKPGGHELFADEIPSIIQFFSTRPRNLYPRQVLAQHEKEFTRGPLAIVEPDPGYVWSSLHKWSVPLPVGNFYWLELTAKTLDREQLPDGTWKGKLATLEARVDSNTIRILALDNVHDANILLSSRLVDFSKPIRVVRVQKQCASSPSGLTACQMIGEEPLFEGRVTPSWKETLLDARAMRDPGRLFEARLSLVTDSAGNQRVVDSTR
jgi:pimeloyl-ACP methyl ester carboxylesterase